jgi:rare lipoprotein A
MPSNGAVCIKRIPRLATIALVLAPLLSACGGGSVSRHIVPPAAQPAAHPVTQSSAPTDVPYKLGRPYVIRGVRYVPRDDPHYSRTGVASWYGKQFHGRKTASGRRYNMYEMTAAHTTLPTGTQVKVTNLRNGRTIIVTITDRGPFAHNRIIDLSYAAAKQLGFVGQGTARVRVIYYRAARKS